MQIIIDYLRARIFDWHRKLAIREAQASADLYRKKFLVLVWQGRPVCVSMQGVRQLIRQKRFRGLTAEKARRIAIFEATPTSRANERRAALAQALPSAAGNDVKRKPSRTCS